MYTHNLDPVMFNFGFFEIRWYSLAYIFGIIIGWLYGKKIIERKYTFTQGKPYLKNFDDLITYLIISLIIGGRLGYVLFYNFEYYFVNPIDIFKIWEGGMSFHGGMIGIIIGTYFFASKKNLKTFFLLDIIACVAPIGIFFGRIANFINGELFGKVTNVKWGVIFSKIDMLPRHPSQLYEAFLEGIMLLVIMNLIILKKNYKIGLCSSNFLIFYGFFRIISEVFREPDTQIGYLFGAISMGSFLSIIMILIGFLILKILKKNEI